MDLTCRLEKQKELTEMELGADTDSDAYEADGSVENNAVEAELQEVYKRTVLMISQTGDIHNVQEAAGMPTDLLDMRQA
jgi:peroxiredoxin